MTCKTLADALDRQAKECDALAQSVRDYTARLRLLNKQMWIDADKHEPPENEPIFISDGQGLELAIIRDNSVFIEYRFRENEYAFRYWHRLPVAPELI